jgi:hypothetical protein
MRIHLTMIPTPHHILLLAQHAYAVIKAKSDAIGKVTMRPWADLPPDLQGAMVRTAEDCLDGHSMAELHALWLEEKLSTGWCYGPTEDSQTKQHPLCKPWHKLDENERVRMNTFNVAVQSAWQLIQDAAVIPQ